jgi:putative ABC transport system permease protein
VAVTLTIGAASSKIIEDTRLRIGSKVNIGVDLLEHGGGVIPEIGIDEFFSYAESEYLSKSIFSVQLYLHSFTTFAVGDESKGQSEWESNDGSGDRSKAATMMLIGSSDPDTLADFAADGARSIMPGGRMFRGSDECVVSSDLAEINGISVGDTIVTTSIFIAAHMLPIANVKKRPVWSGFSVLRKLQGSKPATPTRRVR